MKKFFTKLFDYFCFLIFKQKKATSPTPNTVPPVHRVIDTRLIESAQTASKTLEGIKPEPPLMVLSENNLDKGLLVLLVGGTARVFPSSSWLEAHPKDGKRQLGNLIRSRCRKHFGATNTDGPTHTCAIIYYGGYGYEVKRLR